MKYLACFSVIVLLLLALLPGCKTTPQPTAVSQPEYAVKVTTASSKRLGQIAWRTHELVNKYRTNKGLKALAWRKAIAKQCRIHSLNMAKKKVGLGHKGADKRIEIISKTIPYRAAAENVANNYGVKDPANRAVKGWIKSKHHRENMEGNYNLTGMGVKQAKDGTYYFTQIFIKKM